MRNAFPIKTSLVALVATLAVAGCNRAPTDAADNAQVSYALPELPATLPLQAGTGEPISYAPEASALPDAEPLRVARVADPRQAYGYADAAYEYTDALGEAPPDYAFDYDGVEPWAWQGYDNSLAFAEPIDDGYRTYYYRPGASEPYFIRDPYYSYGFANGLLAVIYAADGGIVPYADYGPRLAYASRYYARGRNLYQTSRRGNRRAIYASNWRAQSPIIFASRQRWGAGRAHQPAWGAYHNANLVRQQRYWRQETIRRRADTQRFATWRSNDFRTQAPPRAIPAAWTNAKWARDERKFRPAGDNIRQAVLEERQQAARKDERAAAAGQKAAQQRVAERKAFKQNAKRDRQQDRAKAQRQEQRADRLQDRAKQQRQQNRRQQQADHQPDRTQAQRQQAQRQQQTERKQQRAQAQRQQQRKQDRTQAERQAKRQHAQQPRETNNAQEQRQQKRAQAQQKQPRQPAARIEQKSNKAAERAQQRQQAQRQQAQQAQRRQAQSQRQAARAETRPQPERASQQPQSQAQPRPQVQQRQEARQERQAARQAARQEKRADRPQRQ